MRKFSFLLIFALGLVWLLAACGGGDSDGAGEAVSARGAGGDPARGEALYKQPVIGDASAPGCNTCHSLEEGVVLVGPSHAGIGARAETAVAGLSAEEYLRKSIVEPNVDITEGYTEGVMYQFYGDDLTDEEIDDLVAFLLTQ